MQLQAGHWGWALALMLLGVTSAVSAARAAEQRPWVEQATLFIDNDLVGLSDDQNYTGGIAASLGGRVARDGLLSLDPVLGAANGVLQLPRLFPEAPSRRRHFQEVGLAVFTPDDITRAEPIRDDHPYACLPFVSNARLDRFAGEDVTYHSSLMVGLLGTDLCKGLQRGAHDVVGSDEPRGWDNQISEGGEPTARWSVTRRVPLYASGRRDGSRLQVTNSLEGALGLTTHVRLGLNARWGRIHSPWWNHAPDTAEYAALGPLTYQGASRGRELYVWASVSGRLRAYNGILQGQFRDSEVTFSRDELNPLIGDFWLGVTGDISRQWRLSLAIRGRSREIEASSADTPFWGTLVLEYRRGG